MCIEKRMEDIKAMERSLMATLPRFFNRATLVERLGTLFTDPKKTLSILDSKGMIRSMGGRGDNAFYIRSEFVRQYIKYVTDLTIEREKQRMKNSARAKRMKEQGKFCGRGTKSLRAVK